MLEILGKSLNGILLGTKRNEIGEEILNNPKEAPNIIKELKSKVEIDYAKRLEEINKEIKKFQRKIRQLKTEKMEIKSQLQ